MRDILRHIGFLVGFFFLLIGIAQGETLPLLDTPAGKAFKARQYDVALAEFKRLAEANPKDVLILRYLALTLDRLRRYDEAIKVYQQALAIAPENPALHFHLGTTYYKAGLPDKADESFHKVLDLAPDTLYGKIARQYLEAFTQQRVQLQPPTLLNLLAYISRSVSRMTLIFRLPLVILLSMRVRVLGSGSLSTSGEHTALFENMLGSEKSRHQHTRPSIRTAPLTGSDSPSIV